ncbi:hypothetical protein GCM10010981_32390 [Dyella nitratireducens]|uniref:Uncharacterized protein n=1 Tax=Dyella nitratireducens TaxID=1849580 RepID=A0ABQ1GBS5_9GAMM|nr:hypothetical protein GCM10010981_32390 [Dyella nitratireducens]GLQ40597.1 hypothetical protein GCM10007902_04460 [Dyella nitratireducens]
MPALQLSPAEAIRLSLESHYASERAMDDPVKAAGQEIDSPCSKLEDTDNHDSAHNDLDNDPECARDGSCNA